MLPIRTLNLAQRTISTVRPAFIMGIVNATPDSFFAGSRGGVDHALRLIDEGADLIDVGAESTRPGASYVSADEEIGRLLPLIKGIRAVSDIPISVDTRKKAVMEAAYDAGADMLNDVSALEDDAALAAFAAEKRLPVVLMHKRGIPATMQDSPAYTDVWNEVNGYLERRVAVARDAGIAEDKIILDPGIGFGKNLAANKTLIVRCGQLCGGRYPVLMALSRKSCIGEMTGEPVEGRLYGTLTANIIAVLCGAFMLRVHDVAPCRNALDVLQSFGADGVREFLNAYGFGAFPVRD